MWSQRFGLGSVHRHDVPSPTSPLALSGWNVATSVPDIAMSEAVLCLQAPRCRAEWIHRPPSSTQGHRADKCSILCDSGVPLVSVDSLSFPFCDFWTYV